MIARASALTGTLADLPLPDLLGFLGSSGQSGTIRFDGPVPAEVHLDAGQVVFADTAGDPELPAHLVATGVDPDAVDAAVDARRRGVPWADALVDAGVPATEVRGALYDHIVNALFEVLLATDDSFSFEPDGESPAGARFPVALDSVLADAERRRRQWIAITQTVPSTAVVLRIAPALPAATSSVTITASDWTVLATVDGRRMLSDAVRDLGRTSFSVCETAHRLLEAGVVERA